MTISTENLLSRLDQRVAYVQGVQRASRVPLLPPAGSLFLPGSRLEFDVLGVGRDEKQNPPPPPDPAQWRPAFENFLTGAYAFRSPVSFTVESTAGGRIRIRLGTWSSDVDDVECARRLQVFRSLLGALYPVVRLTDPEAPRRDGLGDDVVVGSVTGAPIARAPVAGDNVFPIDRVIRSLGTMPWRVSILASPEPPELARSVRESLLQEVTVARAAARSAGHEVPAVGAFEELVAPMAAELLRSQSTGGWRVAVHLEADVAVYPILASVWVGTFSGAGPEGIRVARMEGGGALSPPQVVAAGGIPLGTAETGTGYHYPFSHQSLLSSGALSAYLHLPSREVDGFRIDVAARFDASRHRAPEGAGIVLGELATGGTDSRNSPFALSFDDVSRHTFLCGVTGSGKTTSSLALLRGLDAAGVPFLVLEPAKREYRQLAQQESGRPEALAARLRVLTASGEDGAVLRINPFEVEPGVSLGEHIDLLRGVFAAAFGDMWTPLPQVLERCIRRVYRDRGWNMATERNRRSAPGDEPGAEYPVLAELRGVLDPVVEEFGFDPEARDRILGSLASRIDGLRAGHKGRLFDTRAACSIDALLAGPTVVELERLADDSDKAFLMGLLLVRIVEHHRVRSRRRPPGSLVHVLVIEEAHRLLAAVTAEAGSDTSARRAAVESFANLLAEVRAYGEGIVVIDQVPTKLVSDVLKNTGLKLAHRTVDAEERRALAGAMAMDAGQEAALASLDRGVLAAFSDGDDAPVLVRVPPPHPYTPSTVPAELPPPRHRGCVCSGPWVDADECDVSAALVDSPDVRDEVLRIATAGLRARSVAELTGSELMQSVRASLAPGTRDDLLLGCLSARAAEWLAEEWGARRSWTFQQTNGFADALRALLLRSCAGGADDGALIAYQAVGRERLQRGPDPFPRCSKICAGDLAGRCLFRSSVEMTLEREEIDRAWRDARAADASESVVGYPSTWATAASVLAPEVVGPRAREDDIVAAALCAVQIAVDAEDPPWPPWTRAGFVDAVIGAARAGGADSNAKEGMQT